MKTYLEEVQDSVILCIEFKMLSEVDWSGALSYAACTLGINQAKHHTSNQQAQQTGTDP